MFFVFFVITISCFGCFVETDR